MPVTAEEYYDDNSNHGNYQFSFVKDIVDNILLEIEEEDDHYLKNVKPFLLYKYARTGVKKLAYTVSGTVKPIAYTLDASLKIVMPQDYVDYTRISKIDKDGFYVPLNENRNSDISTAYLRDNANVIVFDNEGDPIELLGANAGGGFKFKKAPFNLNGQNFNTNYSNFSKTGEFNINVHDGVMNFSSNLINETIVLEYISDGVQWDDLKDEDIKVHKYLEESLEDFIYLRAIERRRNVSAAEKQRALQRFNKSKHLAKKKQAGFNLEELAKAMRGRSQWNKF